MLIRCLFFPLLLLCLPDGLVSQAGSPKREVRAAWIPTVRGLNWPKSYDAEEQKRSLILIYQKLKELKFNTVVFQVRARGDLLYPSQYEPWASSLTGTLGAAPVYDPLRFAIEEAHKFGLEFHAWWNVVKVADGPDRPPISSPLHVVNAHPEWVKLWSNRDWNGKVTSTEWWLDMGLPEARAYLVSVAMEMVRNYDIDAIHFDYLRYPGVEFDDEKTFARYGGGMARDDWRRENINSFVRAIYDSIMAVKPMVKVGSAPIGIYKNLPGAEGWQAYVELCQDARRWLEEKKQDYVMPQLYWGLKGNPKFNVLIRDWQANSFGRHVYAGIAAYKPAVLDQIPELIDTTRAAGASGNCFFTFNDVARKEVLGDRYHHWSLIPPMPWKDSIPPNPPSNLTAVEVEPNTYSLRWSPATRAMDGDRARFYAVYRFLGKRGDLEDAANLVSIVSGSDSSYLDIIERPISAQYRYVVTALDKGNVESIPSNVAAIMVPQLVALSNPFQPISLLAQNIPNPFSEVSFVAFELTRRSRVELKIFDARGREVATALDATQDAGRYVVALDGRELSPGQYTYTLQANGFSASRSMSVSR